MCKIYASTDPADFAYAARSIRLHGMVTSIRLEHRFWVILEHMAAEEGVSVPRFLNILHNEVLAEHGEVANFASFLRVICTTYLAVRPNVAAASPAA